MTDKMINKKTDDMTDNISFLTDLIDRALAKGADAADAVFVKGSSASMSVRLGELEDLDRSEAADLGLRVFIGKQQAMVSSSDTREAILDPLVDRAISMARAAPGDPWCGLAEESLGSNPDLPALDIFDDYEPTPDEMEALAHTAEDSARAIEGITNSEGAGVGWGKSEVAIATSAGFASAYSGSSFSISASVLAGDEGGMERDYEYSTARHFSDLKDAEEIGRSAGERTIKRLNPRKAATGEFPVVFDPRVSNSLVGHLSGALNGRSVARGSSFLKDAMGESIFPGGTNIIDDPLRPRGLRSRPFDGEGVATSALAVIKDGVVASWFLDSAAALQLGMKTTGHASRGTSSPPSPSATNLYLEAGDISPEDMIAEIDNGFYVTELIGMGVNGVTGDYSRGASGFWIEKGALSYAVSEVTIASNLKDMFANLIPASDLEFRYGTNAPTVRVDGMTVAGG